MSKRFNMTLSVLITSVCQVLTKGVIVQYRLMLEFWNVTKTNCHLVGEGQEKEEKKNTKKNPPTKETRFHSAFWRLHPWLMPEARSLARSPYWNPITCTCSPTPCCWASGCTSNAVTTCLRVWGRLLSKLHSLGCSASVIGHEINIGIDQPQGCATLHALPCSAWQNINGNGKGAATEAGAKKGRWGLLKACKSNMACVCVYWNDTYTAWKKKSLRTIKYIQWFSVTSVSSPPLSCNVLSTCGQIEAWGPYTAS